VDHPSACGAFAAALLAGAVATPMGDVRERLAGKPSVCARPEGRSQKRVVELVASLQRRGVASKSALATQWRKDPRYLLPEMLGWMKSGQGYALEKLWPKIVASTVQGVGVVKAIEPSAAGVMKRREDEKSVGGAGADAPGSKRAKVVKKKVKKNSKALGSGLSIWD
jgi:ATP-dependent RNA helicase DHX37/DHR1